MPQEDAATGQFEKAQEILGVVFVASDQATKVVQPSEQAFDFPSSPIASPRASVLGGVFAVAPMGSDQLDTLLLQVLIQRIGVVRPIPDQALRLLREEALLERFFDSFVSYREALAMLTATGRPWRSATATILVPLPRRVGPTAEPPFPRC